MVGRAANQVKCTVRQERRRPRASSSLGGGSVILVHSTRDAGPAVAGDPDDLTLDAGRSAGELRADVTAEDVAAALIGIFTVPPRPDHDAQAARLLDILSDGLRPPAR